MLSPKWVFIVVMRFALPRMLAPETLNTIDSDEGMRSCLRRVWAAASSDPDQKSCGGADRKHILLKSFNTRSIVARILPGMLGNGGIRISFALKRCFVKRGKPGTLTVTVNVDAAAGVQLICDCEHCDHSRALSPERFKKSQRMLLTSNGSVGRLQCTNRVVRKNAVCNGRRRPVNGSWSPHISSATACQAYVLAQCRHAYFFLYNNSTRGWYVRIGHYQTTNRTI